MKEKFNTLPPFRQVLMLLAIGIVSFAVISMALNLSLSIFFPEVVEHGAKEQMEHYPIIFMISQFVPLQLGFLLIPSLIYWWFSRKQTSPLSKTTFQYVIWAFLLFVSVFLLLPLLSEINFEVLNWIGIANKLQVEKELSDQLLIQLIGGVNSSSFLVAVILIGFVTGIAEELAFRRFLFHHIFINSSKLGLSLLSSSFIFALLHFNYIQILPLFTFGLALGMMYYVSGRIVPGIIAHTFNNIINIYWLASDSYPVWMEELSLKTTIPSIILLTGLLLYFYRRKRINTL